MFTPLDNARLMVREFPTWKDAERHINEKKEEAVRLGNYAMQHMWWLTYVRTFALMTGVK